MSIAALSRDFTGQFPYLTPGGCTFYRCTLPLSVSGRQTAVGLPAWDPIRGFGIKDTNGTGIFGWRTIILKLIMDRSTPRQIELAQALGQYIIVDVDDYYEGLTEANKAFTSSHPQHNKWSNRENYGRVIAAANMVTVSTPFLLNHYANIHPNVHMIRNGIYPFMFDTGRKPTRKPVIGWTGSIGYRNNDLEQLREWLPDFLEEHDLRFHHAGHDDNLPSFADITGINPKRLTTTPLVPITHYPDGLRFDIGLVPLNDIPFNHAKSNIKGLEYVASGIPYVASNVPEYAVLANQGVGTLATTPMEWREALTPLLDRPYRLKKAKQELSVTEKYWTLESRREEWQRVFALSEASAQTH